MRTSKRPPSRLGLTKGEMRVVPYDPTWVDAFRRIRARLRTILPRARIEHTGSTAVSSGEARPIIDVSVGLAPGTRLRVVTAQSIGLEFRSVSPESTHFVFRDRKKRQIAHVQISPHGAEAELRLLRFRDFLRDHPEVVRAYTEVKHRILETGLDRSRYTAAQGQFLGGLDGGVRRWANRTA